MYFNFNSISVAHDSCYLVVACNCTGTGNRETRKVILQARRAEYKKYVRCCVIYMRGAKKTQ